MKKFLIIGTSAASVLCVAAVITAWTLIYSSDVTTEDTSDPPYFTVTDYTDLDSTTDGEFTTIVPTDEPTTTETTKSSTKTTTTITSTIVQRLRKLCGNLLELDTSRSTGS